MSKRVFAIVAVLSTVACSGSDLAEKETLESLVTRDPDAAVGGRSDGSPGSPEVVLEEDGGGGAPSADAGDAGVPAPAPDAGSSCGASISCSNGSCTCSAGPNKGMSCIGSSSAGASSCAALCYFCR